MPARTRHPLSVRRRAAQGGVSMVELLVAMVLGLLLVSATLSMVLATSRTSGAFDAASRAQEAGRLALVILTRDARMAGYRGCAFGTVNSLLDPTGTGYSDAIYDFNQPFFGWSETEVASIPTATLPASFDTSYVRGDVLVVKNAATPMGVALAADIEADHIGAELQQAIATPLGSLVMASDCGGGGDLFQVASNLLSPSTRLERNANIGGVEPGNLDPSTQLFSRLYAQTETELMLAQSNVYYIGREPDGKGALRQTSGLRRLRMGERSAGVPPDDEILEGVYDMRVQYGVDATGSGSADSYLRADALTAADWERIVSLRISVLVYSGEALAENRNDDEYAIPFDETIWDFAGAEVQTDPDGEAGEQRFVPPDRRVYRFFSTTVAVRNRVG